MKIKIAMCQLLVEGGEPERNFERAEELIKIAKDNDTDIALLPECIDFGWTHPSGLTNAKEIPGKYSDKLCELSKKYKIYICVGLTEKDKSNNKNYNSAILIDENGKIILKGKILKSLFFVAARELELQRKQRLNLSQ